MVGIAGTVFAANPADVTSDYRLFPEHYFKVAYDGGPRWMLFNLPLEDDLALSIQAWQNEESTMRKYNLWLVKEFSPYLDAGLNLEGAWSGGTFTPRSNIGIDLHNENLGFGLIVPLQSDESIKIGPRVKIDDFTAYLTLPFSGETNPVLGLGYKKEGWGIDLAYGGDETWWLRGSKGFETSFGKVTPELRLKFTEDDTVFGLGIGLTF